MKSLKQKKSFSYICFRFLRFFVWLFYPKIRIEGLENLPETPCVVVANHSQMNGPIACEIHFPGSRAIWCAGQMMHMKDVPAYAFADFWSQKPKWTKPFYKVLSYAIAPVSACIFQNANTIAVYRDSRIISTFKNTVQALTAGKNVVVFPECYEPHNHIVNQFQDRFVEVAKLYYKRTGEKVCFVPMYIAPKRKTMYVCEPIVYQPDTPAEEERNRICEYLMTEITKKAESLPVHTVVPYANISKKDYPKSRMEE